MAREQQVHLHGLKLVRVLPVACASQSMKVIRRSEQVHSGYSLIEIMMILAIIGVLTSLALPLFNNHFKKSRFVEVVFAVEAVKAAIEVCYVSRGQSSLENCNTYAKIGLNPNSISSAQHVDSVVIQFDNSVQIIGVAATSASIGTNDNFIIEGSEVNGSILWSLDTGSTCLKRGTC